MVTMLDKGETDLQLKQIMVTMLGKGETDLQLKQIMVMVNIGKFFLNNVR